MSEVDDFKPEKDRYFEEAREEARRIAVEHCVQLRHGVRIGHAADLLVRLIKEVGDDLVVLGYEGHSRPRC